MSLAFSNQAKVSLKYCRESAAGASFHNLVYPAEKIVIQKSIARAALVIVLCAALATPARADKLQSDAHNIEVGIVVVVAAIVVVTIFLVRHESKKDRTITGCVSSAGSKFTITDENDKEIYEIAGNTGGITPGDRIKLKGRKVKSKGPDHTHVLVATKVTKDFGVCQP
jgi:hypothetical protein